MFFILVIILSLSWISCNTGPGDWNAEESPNILLIMTDDQGYGDLGFSGNPVIRTPVLDSLARNSARFSGFYVSPVCAPTRSSLMTGRYSIRTGVYDTYNGGAIMSDKEVTMAEYLKEAGYYTGIFGKWHLGDSYPFRPVDQGFDVSLVHAAGGIGQPGDFYENYVKGDSSYFNPILSRNGVKVSTKGYCSDVYTDHAIEFIRENSSQPFFLYLSYNAPHTPLQLPQEYYDLYRDIPRELFLKDTLDGRNKLSDNDIEGAKRVYGMVTNIDDNLQRLFHVIMDLGIRENTLIIFITDNGPEANRYNAGLRSRKGSVFEGGIRVPSFWSWPGHIGADVEFRDPAAHIDILPTLLDICHIPAKEHHPLDGISLWNLLNGSGNTLPGRELISHWTRGFPEPYHNIALRSGDFKLVGQGSYLEPAGTFALFDLNQDPFEHHDISQLLPDTVTAMKSRFDQWYDKMIRNDNLAPRRIVVGSAHEDPVNLNRNDTKGPLAKRWVDPHALGYWDVTIMEEAEYDIFMRFFQDPGPGYATFRAGAVQRTIRIEGDTSDLVCMPRVRLFPGDQMIEGWFASGEEFYAPIYIELDLKSHE
ncbi:MAG: arylsulfatase [Cyclobacteriaceae bacterium]|nr:arylsulfatase [Cyclobacteriaceae bacterium]